MRVLFIFPNLNTVEGFNHGVADLSGGLKARGHETRLLNINEHLYELPTDQEILELVREYEPFVHAFLLDSGRPNADYVELGGTGRTHDWGISRQIVALTGKPVFLAGGENAVPDSLGMLVCIVNVNLVALLAAETTLADEHLCAANFAFEQAVIGYFADAVAEEVSEQCF